MIVILIVQCTIINYFFYEKLLHYINFMQNYKIEHPWMLNINQKYFVSVLNKIQEESRGIYLKPFYNVQIS